MGKGRFLVVAETEVEERIGPATSEEIELLARLRNGDERAFEALVDRHYGAMLAVARMYVRAEGAAEEVVQEAWLGVLKGLDRFEGRSSLKTWILRIVVNIARTPRGPRRAYRAVLLPCAGGRGSCGEAGSVPRPG